MSITVFLADDHTVVRDGLRMLLDAQPDIEVVGDAADGRDAVRRVLSLRPDVAIMDIAMPALNGIDAARQIREAGSSTEIVMLSVSSSSEHIVRAFKAGARGYLLKESAGSELIEAVRAVHAGQRYVTQKIADILLEGYLVQGGAEPDDPLSRLSDREREILQLVVEGRSNGEIAALLSLSRKTVETYRSRLMEKLGIRDLPTLVKFAIQRGLISLD